MNSVDDPGGSVALALKRTNREVRIAQAVGTVTALLFAVPAYMAGAGAVMLSAGIFVISVLGGMACIRYRYRGKWK